MAILTRNDRVAWDAVVEAVSYEVTLFDGSGAIVNGPISVVATSIDGVDLAAGNDNLSNLRVEIVAVDSNGLKSDPAQILGVSLDLAPPTPLNPRIEPIT
jgi:hypothetical protein